MKNSIQKIILSLSVILLHTGCTSLQTFPVAARAGDTITVALGSYDNMTTDNITVEFLPGGMTPGTGVALTPRSVIRLYADQTSLAYQDPTFLMGGIVQKSGHAPWLNVLVVDLPSSLNTGSTPISGQLYVNRLGGAGTPPIYPGHGTDLPDFWDDPAISNASEDKIKIALTVLPTGTASTGVGASSFFQYELGGSKGTPGIVQDGNLGVLQPIEHYIVAAPFLGDPPSSTYTNATYAAVEMTITLNAKTSGGSPVDLVPATNNNDVRVIADDMDTPYTNSRRSVSYRLTGTNQLTVIMISPSGKLKYFEPRISILFSPLANITWANAPLITNVTYYDINGTAVNPPLVPSKQEFISEHRGG